MGEVISRAMTDLDVEKIISAAILSAKASSAT